MDHLSCSVRFSCTQTCFQNLHVMSGTSHFKYVFQLFVFTVMVSRLDQAKRALVMLLNRLAALYNLVLGVTRDSSEADVRGAYKRLSRKCHPDHGGNVERQKAVNAAQDAWQEAKKTARTNKQQRDRDRRSSTGTQGTTVVLPVWQ